MRTVRVSNEATLAVAELANKEGLTIPEATEYLIKVGYNRTRALQKWRRKERKQRREAKRRN